MALLKEWLFIYFLHSLVAMVSTQNLPTSAPTSTTLPASSTSNSYSSSSTVTSTTQVISSSPATSTTQVISSSPSNSTTQVISSSPATSTTQIISSSPATSTTQVIPSSPATSTTQIISSSPANSTTQVISSSPATSTIASALTTTHVTYSSIATSGNVSSPNSTVQTETNTTVSPNVTSTSQNSTTVSPNVTSTSQNTTALSPNETVTRSTEVPVTSPSKAATVSSSGTPSLTPSVTTASPNTSSATAPAATSPTATNSPTGPPQGNTVVLMLSAVTNGYHPAKVNFTLDTIKRWSKSLCDSQTLKSVANLKIHSGSDYFYDIINVTASPGNTQSNNFVCQVADLPNLSTKTYGVIDCSRDSQSCPAGNSAGLCARIDLKIDQCTVTLFWTSDQNVTMVYNSKVMQLTCKDGKIACSADSGVSQVTGPTLPPQASASTVSNEKGHSGVILGVILSLLVVFIALILGALWWRQRSGQQRGSVQFHNDESQTRASKPVGIRIGEKRTLQRLESSNSNDTDFEFTSVNLSPVSPTPHATIDVSSGQNVYS